MSSHSKSVLLFLRRCVAVRQLTSTAALRTTNGNGPIQRAWSSASRTVCLRGLGALQPISRQRSFCTETGSPCESQYPPLPPYQPNSEPVANDVYIIQVKGLPWSCTAQDLMQFFSECNIREGEKGIHLILDGLGRPSGKAFIEMEHEEDVKKALERHRQYIGSRYIQVFEVTNCDAESLLKNINTAAEDFVVQLRGIPFTCSQEDISNFFSGLDIVEDGITIMEYSSGRRTGIAFVQFSSREAAAEALQRDRELIGDRYIELFPSTRDELELAMRRLRGSAPSQGNFSAASRRSAFPESYNTENSTRSAHYVHLRGLPFQVTGEDIVKFFTPLLVSKIVIECGRGGRPNGKADVYFWSHEDAVAAMSRNKMSIGHRYIELFLNSGSYHDGR